MSSLLIKNYPNPFNPSTNISFALPLDSKVSVKKYNDLGQVVTELVDGNFSAGMHKIKFNASKPASGIYFYNITADATDGSSFSETKKMILMK